MCSRLRKFYAVVWCYERIVRSRILSKVFETNYAICMCWEGSILLCGATSLKKNVLHYSLNKYRSKYKLILIIQIPIELFFWIKLEMNRILNFGRCHFLKMCRCWYRFINYIALCNALWNYCHLIWFLIRPVCFCLSKYLFVHLIVAGTMIQCYILWCMQCNIVC